MKLRNPKRRTDLSIRRKDRVLEVGGGHNPHPRSNVVVDKFVDTNYHRNGNIKVLKNQQFMQADGENLPFKDHEFDYVICCQVLEHVDDPEKFLREQFRVAKKGFLEVPALLGEYLYARESHRWIMHEVDDVLYIVDKKAVDFNVTYNLKELVQGYLPQNSIGFKMMSHTHPNILTTRIEWDGDFKFVVNPTDPEILKYFKEKWEAAWADKFFPPRTVSQECIAAVSAIYQIVKTTFKAQVLNQRY